MCWACEQDRFWAAYAQYMAGKETAVAANADKPAISDPNSVPADAPHRPAFPQEAATPATALPDD